MSNPLYLNVYDDTRLSELTPQEKVQIRGGGKEDCELIMLSQACVAWHLTWQNYRIVCEISGGGTLGVNYQNQTDSSPDCEGAYA